MLGLEEMKVVGTKGGNIERLWTNGCYGTAESLGEAEEGVQW